MKIRYPGVKKLVHETNEPIKDLEIVNVTRVFNTVVFTTPNPVFDIPGRIWNIPPGKIYILLF